MLAKDADYVFRAMPLLASAWRQGTRQCNVATVHVAIYALKHVGAFCRPI